MIMAKNLSQMKDKNLRTCLKGNYRVSLGEFNNTSYGEGVDNYILGVS